MTWTDTLLKAIDYIENNIESEIDYDVIAELSCLSFYNFQRVFVFIFNITVAEYIRYRRLSLAALELLHSDLKIIDISFKYGYETPESFSRAFNQFHGILPSEARKKDYMLKFCSRATIETSSKSSVKIGKLKEVSINHILDAIKIKQSYNISPIDLTVHNEINILNLSHSSISVTCADDKGLLLTDKEYNLPLKIDITAKTDSTNLKLVYGSGDIVLNWQYSDWNYKLNELMIRDIITEEHFGYPDRGTIEIDRFIDISWVINKKYMALIVDGELRYYNEYLPYITQLMRDSDSSFGARAGVAPAWGSVITISNFTINEIE